MVDPEATIIDLEAQGFTHFELRCQHGGGPENRRTVQVPFRIFRGPRDVPFAAILPRLRCEVCGRYVQARDVRPYHHGMTIVPFHPHFGKPEPEW